MVHAQVSVHLLEAGVLLLELFELAQGIVFFCSLLLFPVVQSGAVLIWYSRHRSSILAPASHLASASSLSDLENLLFRMLVQFKMISKIRLSFY
jgi:hypothetical protein